MRTTGEVYVERPREAPQEVFHEGNSVVPTVEYEGDRRRRPLNVDILDERITRDPDASPSGPGSPFQPEEDAEQLLSAATGRPWVMTFLVAVEHVASGWRVDQDALTEAILGRWTDAAIRSENGSEVRSLIWEFETRNGPGEAYLHAEGTCLYMDVREDDAIWLAVLFRELTPDGLDLVFCDEGYTFDVRLQPGTTEAELADLVNRAS
ncbi:hypothetical protein ACQEV4_26185 [Streptomyces shenzhenensis]|uniref:hypothetical protein n=1 Tax=Streptomyces shenzhenensis TaxID=943815 RepID=UPI003D89DE82